MACALATVLLRADRALEAVNDVFLIPCTSFK